jgi:hypothetical protein
MKTASTNSCKNLSAINGRIKIYGSYETLLKSSRPDLLFTEYQFQSNHKEHGLRKLV